MLPFHPTSLWYKREDPKAKNCDCVQGLTKLQYKDSNCLKKS